MNTREIYVSYIQSALPDTEKGEIRFLFEKQLLEKMLQKEQKALNAGLNDQKVLTDLVKSEYPDVYSDYKVFFAEQKQLQKEKKVFRMLCWGSLIALVAMFLSYFSFSFITGRWGESWIIIIGFVTVWFDVVAAAGIKKLTTMKKVFQIPARIIAGLAVMLTTSFIFLICLNYYRFENYWVIFPAGVIMIFVVDAIYAYKTKQRMKIINYLIYVPAAMPMLYLVLGGLHVIPWSPGWMLMPLSVLIDIVIAVSMILNNRKYVYKPEKEEEE